MRWAAEWQRDGGLHGDSHSNTNYFEVDKDKLALFTNGLPFWLRIGPISWEGVY